MRTHRRQVAQIHGQRAMADGSCRKVREEMDAGHERVDFRDQLHAGGRLEQRRVVADADAHVRSPRAAVAEEAFDECALGKRHQALLNARSGRSVRAARSSTALTNLWPSVAPKRLARLTPSLITTRYGTSGRDFSS